MLLNLKTILLATVPRKLLSIQVLPALQDAVPTFPLIHQAVYLLNQLFVLKRILYHLIQPVNIMYHS